MADIAYNRATLVARQEDCLVSAENLKKNFQEVVVDTLKQLADDSGYNRIRNIYDRAVKLRDEGIATVCMYYTRLADTIERIIKIYDQRGE